jgi:hypothetical protein
MMNNEKIEQVAKEIHAAECKMHNRNPYWENEDERGKKICREAARHLHQMATGGVRKLVKELRLQLDFQDVTLEGCVNHFDEIISLCAPEPVEVVTVREEIEKAIYDIIENSIHAEKIKSIKHTHCEFFNELINQIMAIFEGEDKPVSHTEVAGILKKYDESIITLDNIPDCKGKLVKHKHGTGGGRLIMDVFESQVRIEGVPHRVDFDVLCKDWSLVDDGGGG